jgi:uncharacterized protein with PIN domain
MSIRTVPAQSRLDGRCPSCGADELESVDTMYATGVVAPDGGQERRRFIGWRCKVCGRVEEED